MSRKDYTRYSNRDKRAEDKLTAEAAVQVENVEFKVKTETAEVVVEAKAEPKNGVVTDCARLNVRSEARSTADVVCTIDASTNLVIYEDESTEEFYKICTFSGVEGYCMKKFITILP